MKLSRRMRLLMLLCFTSGGLAHTASADPAVTLRASHAVLADRLQHNQFGRPMVLDSVESPKRLTGEIHAIVEYPFAQVRTALNDPGHWCDVISLHVNTKYCRPSAGPAGPGLRVHIGKKSPEELDDAARVDFAYRAIAASAEYFDTVLVASEGPMGTSDYRIELEAAPLSDAKTFIHLTYSYAFNFTGKLAMQTYLATLGRDKVGFTPTGKVDGGRAALVGGMRGLVERNAMRYYLAIDAFLQSPGAAPAQFEQRLQTWFTATEQYPRQLHEVERMQYVEMKRAENARQQAVVTQK